MLSRKVFGAGLFLAAMAVSFAAPSYVTDGLMDWDRGDAGTTYQEWTFDDAAAPSAVADYYNPYGTPTATISGSSSASVDFGWYESYFAGDQQRDGVWAGDPIYISLSIDNTPDANPYKIIWFEMEYRAVSMLTPSLDLDSSFEIERFYYDSGKEYDNNGLLIDDWRTMTIGWIIYPNPTEEVITFALQGTGGFVNSIAVDTRCVPVPAPSAFLLTGIGVLLTRRFGKR